MSVPTIFNLSCKKIAKCIRDEKFTSTDLQFPPKIGQQIFDELGNIHFRSTETALSIAHQLKVTRVDFRMKNGVSVEDRAFLSQQEHLVSLELGSVTRDPSLDQALSVAEFVARGEVVQCEKEFIETVEGCLAEGSRRSLRHFGVETDGLNPAGVVLEITRILPHLTSLNLNNCFLSANDLTVIRTHYRHLTMLEFCMHRVFDVRGISSLRHLEHLSIGCSAFQESHGIPEIFRMHSLQTLDVSTKDDSPRNPLFDELFRLMTPGSFPNLRLLDLSGNRVTKEIHEEIVNMIPSLRQVVLINTPLRTMNPDETSPVPRILNLYDLASVMKSLHFMKGKKHHIVQTIYNISEIFDDRIYATSSLELRNYSIRKMCELLVDIELPHFDRATFQIAASRMINTLCSNIVFQPLTVREVESLNLVYDRKKHTNSFWFFAETYWFVMEGLCQLKTFDLLTQCDVIERAIEVLAVRSDPRVLTGIFKFLERLSIIYPKTYLFVLKRLRQKVDESMEFCKLYVEQGYARNIPLGSIFVPVSIEVREMELQLLLSVVLKVTEHLSFELELQSAVVAHLLSLVRPSTLDILGHYAFSILLILQKHNQLRHPEQNKEFNKAKSQKPLKAEFVKKVHEIAVEVELMKYVKKDQQHFSIA